MTKDSEGNEFAEFSKSYAPNTGIMVRGTYDEKNGTITLYENTYIVLDNGLSLEADKLTWAGSDKDIIAEGNVKIKKDAEMDAIANKCIINPQYNNFKIIGKSRTKIYGKGS